MLGDREDFTSWFVARNG